MGGVSGKPMTLEPVMSIGRQAGRYLVDTPGVVCDQQGRAIIVSWAVRSEALS
jgi:hypothetical protein